MEALLYAIDTVKFRHPYISKQLRDTKIGTIIFDNCFSTEKAIHDVINFETCTLNVGYLRTIMPQNAMAYIGALHPKTTETLAEAVKKPQISPTYGEDLAEKRADLPLLLSAAPPDNDIINAYVAILTTIGFKHVSVLYTNNTFGYVGYQLFKQKAEENDLCIATALEFPLIASRTQIYHIIRQLKNHSSARAVVVVTNVNFARPFLQAAERNEALGFFTWIGPEIWVSGLRPELQLALGAIIVRTETIGIPGFNAYFESLRPETNKRNPWFVRYWMDQFRCDLPNTPRLYGNVCQPNMTLSGIFRPHPITTLTIQAFDAIIHGIARANNVTCLTADLCPAFTKHPNRNQLIFNSIERVSFNYEGSSFQYNDDKGVYGWYSIFNYQNFGLGVTGIQHVSMDDQT